MTIFVTIPQGQCIRDFLVLGILEQVLNASPNEQLVLLSPAWQVPAFKEMCPTERVSICRMETPTSTGRNTRLTNLRRQRHDRFSIKWLLKLEARRFQAPAYLQRTFAEYQPRLVVSTHPMPTHDYEVIMTARKYGVPTIGVVKSWDNIGKGLTSRPQLLSVWNPVNRDEALAWQGYRSDEVAINGSPSFDPYFDERWHLPRADFWRSLGLDPARPVITYATSGVYDMGYYGRDETYLADDLLRLLESEPALHGAQLLIRLHPSSRLEFFDRFRQSAAFSYASYMPTIGWYTGRHDILEQTNLLKHSDVIVTPGSSWAIEAAIFDTPTVVPVYSDLQPEHARAQFDSYTLVRHFRPLVENDWVPICRSFEQLRTEVVQAVQQPERYQNGRQAIVENYVYHRDAHSCRRVADWIVQQAQAQAVACGTRAGI